MASQVDRIDEALLPPVSVASSDSAQSAMTTSAQTPSTSSKSMSKLAIYYELTKPRVTLMVLMTTAVGMLCALPDVALQLAWFPALAGLVGTYCLAAGASALNMWMEAELDSLMDRTRQRPLPSGRLERRRALVFGTALTVVGALILFTLVNSLTAIIGLCTTASYLLLYTPLKRRTPYSTHVGAIPGALPPLMGWTAITGVASAPGWVLFAVLLLWQMPHFFAISWMYREDYREAGFMPLGAVDTDEGFRTGYQTVVFTVLLLVVSLLPQVVDLSTPVYSVVAAGLGLAFLGRSIAFARERSVAKARATMMFSVLYLPALLAVLVIDRLASQAFALL